MLLELLLVLPTSILDGKSDVGTVLSGGVGAGAASGLTYRDIELRGLLDGMLADEVLVERLVSLGGHLFIWLMKRSRKTPEQEMMTLIAEYTSIWTSNTLPVVSIR